MNVLIAGAGNVGRYLARILEQSGHSVTIIDLDDTRVEQARAECGATVVHGDATEPALLERSGIRAMDVVVAATGDDEDNLVLSNLAKTEFLVGRTVGRVKNARNAWLYEPDMGVDVLISAPHTIAQLIEEQVAVGDVVQLLELAEGQAALLEVTLPTDSPVAGLRVRDVAWPADCALAALIRGSRVLSAPAESILDAGDRLLLVADVAQVQSLHKLLGASVLPRSKPAAERP
jgi:trk system potassium uptake protein TrkA